MSLDFNKTLVQMADVVSRMKTSQNDRNLRLSLAAKIMKATRENDLKEKLSLAKDRPFLWANPNSELGNGHSPTELPEEYAVVAVDGSHIDVDRHLPVPCSLINIGTCILQYGTHPNAHLSNYPKLYSDEGLYLTEHGTTTREVAIEGPILGFKRTIDEVRELEKLISEIPSTIPTLALVDGSLVLWGLSGQGYPNLVRQEFLDKGILPILDNLKQVAQNRTISVAAYVSLPRSTEVVNALRLYLCDTNAVECKRSCSNRMSPFKPCDLPNDLLDRELFDILLKPGQRSELFFTNSSIVREHYNGHQIYFFYINNGREIARIEVPDWVATNETLVSLTHALILDQCYKGRGYPVSISEAHQQAVINGSDRQTFKDMLSSALTRQGLPTYTSEKTRSKRLAWL